MAFKITSVQNYVHILNAAKLEFHSIKEKNKYLSVNGTRFILFEKILKHSIKWIGSEEIIKLLILYI